MDTKPSLESRVDSLLERLKAAGGTAWAVRGQLRLRPLARIPAPLQAELQANATAVMEHLAARPKRRKYPAPPSAEEKLRRRTRNALIAHCGGKVTATKLALIDRVTSLTVICARLDAKIVDQDGDHGDGGSRRYLAYSNSLCRALRSLGLDAVPEPAPSHQQWLSDIARTAPALPASASPEPMDDDDEADEPAAPTAFLDAAE